MQRIIYSVLCKLIFFTVLFFYVYSIAFTTLPFSTHVIIGLFGFICWSCECLRRNKIVFFDGMPAIIKALFIVSIIAIVSFSCNVRAETKFIFYFFPVIVYLFGSFFIYRLANRINIKWNFENISYYFTLVVFTQVMIAVAFACNPSLKEFMLSIQRNDSISPETIEEMLEFRLIGFGSVFFFAGISNGMALILLVYLFAIKYKSSAWLLFLHISIFIIGMTMSRTTIIGLFASLLFLFIVNLRSFGSFLVQYVSCLSIIIAILFFFISWDDLEGFYKYGFELIDNYFSGNGFETQSTNELQELYVYPSTLGTYIIGDSRWMDLYSDGMYYMHTDVGYLRLIFYFGIIGLGSIFYLEYTLINVLCKKNISYSNALGLVCILFFFILNFKGFAELSNILLLFLFLPSNKKMCYVGKNISHHSML